MLNDGIGILREIAQSILNTYIKYAYNIRAVVS